MNILIAQNGIHYNNYLLNGWPEAIHYFGHRKLINVLTALTTITPDKVLGEDYDTILTETIQEFIGKRADDQDENSPAPPLTEEDRSEIVSYIKTCVKALRPYMPTVGSLELLTYVTDPDYKTVYLVVRHTDECDYSTFANPSIRG